MSGVEVEDVTGKEEVPKTEAEVRTGLVLACLRAMAPNHPAPSISFSRPWPATPRRKRRSVEESPFNSSILFRWEGDGPCIPVERPDTRSAGWVSVVHVRRALATGGRADTRSSQARCRIYRLLVLSVASRTAWAGRSGLHGGQRTPASHRTQQGAPARPRLATRGSMARTASFDTVYVDFAARRRPTRTTRRPPWRTPRPPRVRLHPPRARAARPHRAAQQPDPTQRVDVCALTPLVVALVQLRPRPAASRTARRRRAARP